MKSKISLTFDYEIFFGEKSGTFENCIYRPVEKLRKAMKEYEIKGIFFIDIMYYIKLLEIPELKYKALLMEEQIKNLVKDGHKVELHLHPHWINSTYNNGKWIFKYDKYRFDQLTKQERNYIFEIGFNTLNKIVKSVDQNYKLRGYRAGGWCIQPFENFYPYFKKYNLEYDSSVIEGIKEEGEGHKLDFTNIPSGDNYNFSKKIEKEKKDGEFIEYKISYFSYNFFDKCLNKIICLLIKEKIYGDGIPMIMKSKNNKVKRILNKLKTVKNIYTLEGNMSSFILLHKLSKEKKENIVFLSHPKAMTNYGINIIKKLKIKGYSFKTF